MPQARPEDRDRAIRMWGNIGPEGPIAFLEARGRLLETDGTWTFRIPRRSADLTEDEQFAICFLCDEWDFGGAVWEDAPEQNRASMKEP